MPLVDSNLQATWDSLYRCRDGNGQVIHYVRAGLKQYVGDGADILIDVLAAKGMVAGQRIALVGAGFGWVAERFVARGFGPMANGTAAGRVAAIDTSTWIQANRAGNANVNILNADVNGATGRRAVRQEFGSNNTVIDWAITEDVLPILSGTVIGQASEIVPFCQSVRALATNVAHWLTTGTRRYDNPEVWAGDSRLNWKTLEDWKAWTTPDWVVARNENGRVL